MYNYWGGENILSPPHFSYWGGAAPPRPPAFYASAIDHAFVLHLVIEMYQSARKRVFCAFIDFRKASDSIDRSLL